MSEYIPFTGDPLDRASNQRRDDAWIQALLAAPESRFLVFSKLTVLVTESEAPALVWLDSSVCRHLPEGGGPALLGLRDGVAHFVVDLSHIEDAIAALGLKGVRFAEVRGLAPLLPEGEAGTVAHARSLLDWHNRHGFCAACGQPTIMREAGYMRKCDGCGAQHFPRTDPVVIMVVWRGDSCLLGRRKNAIAGLHSALAGFIDQGETIEEAVRREVKEEVGLDVDDVEYQTSQPWPFPSSLMIGCFAHATSDEPHVDEYEIESARWFTRAELRRIIAGSDPDFSLPGPVAIAHHIIKRWSELQD